MPRTPSSPRPDLLTVMDAAELLGICTKTLRKYISEGRLTAVRVGPALLRIDIREIENFLRPAPAPRRRAPRLDRAS